MSVPHRHHRTESTQGDSGGLGEEGRFRKPTWWSEGVLRVKGRGVSKVRKRPGDDEPNGDPGSDIGPNEIRMVKILYQQIYEASDE